MSKPTPPATAAPTFDRPMMILGLEVSQYRRIRAVRLGPDGKPVVLGGDNDQGKSSLLDAIQDLMGGAKNGAGTDVALRTGALRGEIKGFFGEEGQPPVMMVRRQFKASGASELTLEAPVGSELKSPQAVLDKLYNVNCLDPLAFSKASAKDQADMLRKAIGVDTRDVDARRAAAYAKRTRANEELKSARVLRDQLEVPQPPPPAPPKPSVAALLDRRKQLEDVATANRRVEQASKDAADAFTLAMAGHSDLVALKQATQSSHGAAEVALAKIDNARSAIAEALKLADDPELHAIAAPLVESAEQLETAARKAGSLVNRLPGIIDEIGISLVEQADAVHAAERRAAEAQLAVAHLVDPSADLAAVEQELRDADTKTAAHEAGRRLLEAFNTAHKLFNQRAEDVETAQAKADELDAEVKACEVEKQALLAAAKIPVEGLDFDGETVMFRGVPFSQAAQSWKLRVGIAIVSALNPTFRAVLCREGAFLDDTALVEVIKICEEQGLQPWIEVVGEREGSGVGVIIMEDGKVGETKAAKRAKAKDGESGGGAA